MMEVLRTFAARLVVIAAVASVCEQFLRPGRLEKCLGAIAGLMAAGAMVDALVAWLGK